MGATYADVKVTALKDSGNEYFGRFLVDTGATDSIAPAKELERIGVERVGSRSYELADGRLIQFEYGLALMDVMGTVVPGLIVFGPDDAEPILGLVALESAALKVNPVTQQLEKLPAVMLK
jgi:predicted aspartyl protease